MKRKWTKTKRLVAVLVWLAAALVSVLTVLFRAVVFLIDAPADAEEGDDESMFESSSGPYDNIDSMILWDSTGHDIF